MKLNSIDDKLVGLVTFTANELCRLRFPDYRISKDDVRLILQSVWLLNDLIKLKEEKNV